MPGLSFYSLIRPILFRLPAESAHEFALKALRAGLSTSFAREAVAKRLVTREFGSLNRFGLEFANPIGLAAGVDKNGSYTRELAALGFGFIEVGTVRNESQRCNPNHRELQAASLLKDLLTALQRRNAKLAAQSSCERKPLLLKIAPDLSESEIEEIVAVAVRANIAGIIATNTTVRREALQTPATEVQRFGDGGLSGAPLRSRSIEVISFIYNLTRGTLPIIGVGGVFSAEDAWEKICAGASLVQLYIGFIYQGPGVVRRVNEG